MIVHGQTRHHILIFFAFVHFAEPENSATKGVGVIK